MTKKITISFVLSLLFTSLLTATGVFGAFSRLGDILLPGSLLCRRFLDSQDAAYMDGGMMTPVIWTSLTFYTFLIFPVLMYAQKLIHRAEDEKR